MASPDPGAYHHHYHPHHQEVYEHREQPQQPPPPLPSPPTHVYGERPHHNHQHLYTDQPPPQPHHMVSTIRHTEMEQPLDLSVARSPRPVSAGSMMGYEGCSKRLRLEEEQPSRGDTPLDMARAGGHPGVCMLRGCGCQQNSAVVSNHHHPQQQHLHHHHHHHHSPYSRHLHSPYPRYAVPGHSSPTVGEMQPYLHPYPSSVPPPPPPPPQTGLSSSPAIVYGSNPSPSPYLPSPHDRRSCSPAVMPTYGGSSDLMHSSPGPLLCPPSHSSLTPLSVSPRPKEPSPRPPSQNRMRDVSPRPLFRPFGDFSQPPTDTPHYGPAINTGTRMSAMEHYPSEDDLTASSSLLMLSSASSESRSSSATRQIADSSMEEYRQPENPVPMKEGDHEQADASQDSSAVRIDAYYPLAPRPPASPHMSQPMSTDAMEHQSEESREHIAHKHSKHVGPAQDGTVASSCLPEDPSLAGSSAVQGEEKNKKLQSRFVKVIGTTPLAALREERAKRQAELSRERMKELVAQHHMHHVTNSNDSEGGSDHNSSGQASPRSTDGSENDVAQGFPIPPDPNLKMSALDYLISKVLVERIDVPFKACNTEIREIYTGVKKGRLTLVDLIELQVEASLKA